MTAHHYPGYQPSMPPEPWPPASHEPVHGPSRGVRVAAIALSATVAFGGLVAAGNKLVDDIRDLGSVETSQDEIHGYLKSAPDVLGEDLTDPRQRANSVTLLGDGWQLGSASIVNDANGQLHLVTVEHVARPYANLPSVVAERARGISAGSGQQADNEDSRAFVPGLGLLQRQAEPVFVNGFGAVVDDNQPHDHVAEVPLTKSQQQALKQADEAGVLDIAEISHAEPQYGQILELASPTTGANIPLMYVGDTHDGGLEFMPLVMLDQDLDPVAGRQRLDAAMDEQRAAFVEQQRRAERAGSRLQLPTDMEGYLRSGAVAALLKEFEATYGYQGPADEARTTAISRNLPCHGDSGGAVVDADNNVLGVLSAGSQFKDPFSFLRTNAGSAAQECLGSAVVRPLPDKLPG